MELREFKKWIIDNGFENNELFQEALVCYCNRANRAAYMLSYLAFIEYLKERILDYKGIPIKFEEKWRNRKTKDNSEKVKEEIEKEWKKNLKNLNDEDNWDSTLKDIINERDYNIFCYDEKIRREFEVKKNHRNTCAHNKERKITNSTVEDLWDFIAYVKPLSVINGVSKYIIEWIDKIIRYGNKEEYIRSAEDIFIFYKELVGEEKKKVFYEVCEQINLYELVDSNIFLIELFELIFDNRQAEENKWVDESDKYALFMKVNVNNYSGDLDKSDIYDLLEKNDSKWYTFSNHYSTRIVKNGSDYELMKKFLIEVYNGENHYDNWINMVLVYENWERIVLEQEFKDIIQKDEHIKTILDDIKKLYLYDNGYRKNNSTDTFDYSKFITDDKIVRKIILILMYTKDNIIDKNDNDIQDLIKRCKLIKQSERYEYMCDSFKRYPDVYKWL